MEDINEGNNANEQPEDFLHTLFEEITVSNQPEKDRNTSHANDSTAEQPEEDTFTVGECLDEASRKPGTDIEVMSISKKDANQDRGPVCYNNADKSLLNVDTNTPLVPTKQQGLSGDKEGNKFSQPMEHPLCEPCSFDSDTIQASAFCIECTEYICNACHRDHKKNKMTRGHKVLIEDEIPTSKKTFELLKSIGFCKTHPEKEIEYKCIDHDEYICTICEGRSHRKCGRVEEIQTLTNADDDRKNAESLIEKFGKNIELVLRHRQQTHDNIESLEKDLDDVKGALAKAVEDVIDIMQTLKEKSSDNAETMVKDKINAFHVVVDNGKSLIDDYQRERHVIQMAINHGNPKQVYLVAWRVNGILSTLERRLDNFKIQEQFQLRFFSNMEKLLSFELGTTKLFDKLKEADTAKSSDNETTLGSDSLIEETEDVNRLKKDDIQPQVTPDTYVKPDAAQPVDPVPIEPLNKLSIQLVGTHNVRQNNCTEVCNIYGCIFSQDKLILIDNSNCLLILLNENFAFKGKISLSSKPLGLCVVDDNVVVTLEKRRVQQYQVLNRGFLLLNEFGVKLHCRALARAGQDIAILMSDEDYDTDISETDVIEVHIRRPRNGNKVKVVDNFTNKSGEKVKMNDPRCLLYTPDEHILIGDKFYIADFDGNSSRTRIFKSYKNHFIRGIRGLTMDNEGNMYACGNSSNNVHQISLSNFYENRIVIPNILQPWAVAFDPKGKRLVVSCEKSDFMYEYKFTN